MELTEKKLQWSADLKRVYQRFPASIRSKDWPEIVRLANSGDVDGAKALAKANEDRSRNIRAENVTARRIKILRVALFALQNDGEGELKSYMTAMGDRLEASVLRKEAKQGAIPDLSQRIHDETVALRSFMNQWLRRMIRNSVLMGFRNMGDALKPIFRDNQEMFASDLEEVALIEDRLTFGISKKLAKTAKPTIAVKSQAGYRVYDKILKTILQTNVKGLKPSERIWELTIRAEQEMKKILINGIAKGQSPAVTSRQIRDYLRPEILSRAEGLGPGVYRSPFKNAMRLARTETGKAYTNASASWAMEKPWVEGLIVTLSAAHDVEDECDEWAGKLLTPEEFSATFPLHPHCMCFPTIKIKTDYLVGRESIAV